MAKDNRETNKMIALRRSEVDLLEATRFGGRFKSEADVFRAGLTLIAQETLGEEKVVEILGGK